MKALCLNSVVTLQDVPSPEKAAAEHLIVKMIACGINLGDHAFIAGMFAKGTIPASLYDICGVSGVGIVEQIGDGVPLHYRGKKVTIYRSLKFSNFLVGTWSEIAHIHQQHCVILPDDINAEEYAGSLVNIITPFAFLKQVMEEGHKGIIATAGTSATGIAMLGICQAYNFPLISIVRNEAGKQELEALGAKNIVIQTDADFKQQLTHTAIFDGVGGALLNDMLDVLPPRSTVYSYGYLGGFAPLTVNLGLLMRKQLTIKSFGNFTSKTVQTPELLDNALEEISKIIAMPHFKTKVSKRFSFEEIGEALQYTAGKAILYPY